jgi:secondary thiamine-phosphate synthase enzyme
MQRLKLQTEARSQMVEITELVRQIVASSSVVHGQVLVYVPHTTAGVTINENADPDVVHDMLHQLDQMVPWRQSFYRHGEGNSAAHVKASMMGSSVTVLIEQGRLVLGTWQGIWFCEFDGPRTRSVIVKVTADTGGANPL